VSIQGDGHDDGKDSLSLAAGQGKALRSRKRAKERWPRMLELLREIEADFTCGDWRVEIRALLAEIDGD